jgi:uncharacterized lipoprotein YmbA
MMIRPSLAFGHATALSLTAALGLAGCGTSPPPRYHALSGGVQPVEESAGAAALLVEVLPVAIPERLDRDGVTLDGPPGGTLRLHDTDRWAAPLADEIRQIVDDALWRRLRAADSYRAPIAPGATAGLPLYRLSLRIERFDARPGSRAVVEGSWSARRLPAGAPIACRAAMVVPLPDDGVDAAVAALSQGATRLGAAVAGSLDRLHRGLESPCGAGG